MRSFLVGIVAVSGLLTDVGQACAAWDNVFQPTLFGRLRRTTTAQYYTPPVVVSSSPIVAHAAPVVAHSAPACPTPCPTPCPQQQCQTSYTQRCYYQPVTTMETQTYYQPVTTYRTSYYYEQVTSYRYSCYYDPCTCSYQQVATPVCNMELRAKSCPVQSWVARCVQVPKTTMVKSCYLEPQTTCCTTTTGPLIPVPANGAPAMPPAVAAPPVVTPSPPVTTPAPTMPPSIGESRSSPTAPTAPPNVYDRYYPAPGASFKPSLGSPVPASSPTPPPPPVKLDRIALGGSTVEGQVVRSDNSPKPNAKVLFVNTHSGARETATANTAGRFDTNLSAGNWLVYLHGADDTPLFYTRINVGGATAVPVKLVSR